MDVNSFFAIADSAIAGNPAVQASQKTKAAKEGLDNNSTQEDFIEAIAKAGSQFIRENRMAFSLDDAEAVKELAEVFSVESVSTRILELVQTPDEPIEEEEVSQDSDDTDEGLTLEDTGSQTTAPKEENPELVSDDVMKLLEE